MGVQGLWTLVNPVARPTQLESLRRKRVAVDASIWIHQFMRTMRDKEGQALRNGHLLGFFRRICKLLFFDIKPVFVFDGGAPSLKRNTIRERRKRREGVRLNLKATARKILSAQVKSHVLLEQERKQHGTTNTDKDSIDYVYYDELQQSTTKEAIRKKRKLDQFELPDIDQKVASSRLNKLDPRLATTDELRDFVNEFNPSDMDIDSESFSALPPEVQYEVIQDRMWKSRSTSWERLDHMVRNSSTALDFSKQQIKLLKHRNTMTQRLHQASSMQNGAAEAEPIRIASERGRQYVLYKNEDLDQGLGWKLPGLSAAQPLEIDVTPASSSTRSEPALEVPLKHELSSATSAATKEPEDKVAAAMASNPKLAGLFDQLLSESEEEEEFQPVDTNEIRSIKDESTDDDEPLFLADRQHDNLADDMHKEQPHDDFALNQVISRIYEQDSTEDRLKKDRKEAEDSILSLDLDDFYDVWLSRVPDAFIYLHSFNDEYKKIIKRAIEDSTLESLFDDLEVVKSQLSKTNELDELTLEALRFQQSFLESTSQWKQRQSLLHEPLDVYFSEEEADIAPLTSTKEHDSDQHANIILDDDEEEEEIRFVSTTNSAVQQDEKHLPELADHTRDDKNKLHIDANESSLRPAEAVTDILSSEEDVEFEALDDPQSKVELVDPSREEVVVKNQKEITIKEEHSTDQKHFTKETELAQAKELKGLDKNETNEDQQDMTIEHQEISDVQNNAPKAEMTHSPVNDHGYNSEDELGESFRGEDDEFVRFVSDISSKKMDDIKHQLFNDLKELNKQKRKEMGNSDEVTDQMVQDIQELLKLFGIPYIVSPMEAEAQCAALEHLSLVDGTITDDSDVFLFGASRVYKNMFNQQKYVECFMSQDIEREMLLSRKNLIQLAFLLGSDYTDGIPGVGPVAAMEILAEFSGLDEKDQEPLEKPLEQFRDWYLSNKDTTPFQKKFRKRHPALAIPDDFPNPIVKNAYYHPTVDDSSQQFEWGQPQLELLRTFLMEAFGWPEDKADQVLLPVLREMNKKKATGEQSTIGSFFQVAGNVSSTTTPSTQKKHSSKRVQNIVDTWRKQKKAKKQA
ncbi:hypothetical protein BD560DRAFT_426449 [Blakeslea trispora]|nr:hypothetical protein BD560DRAFT_426449 [Blakeslea trispora]